MWEYIKKKCNNLKHRWWMLHHRNDIRFNELKEMIYRCTPQTRLSYVVIDINEHCNLNCKGCDHFAPLASKNKNISVDQVKLDVENLSRISGGNIDTIAIMGGEPLLHPNIIEIIKFVREKFANSEIQLDSNGLLIPKQNEEFWRVCESNKIKINITKYPINFDYTEIERLCTTHKVDF